MPVGLPSDCHKLKLTLTLNLPSLPIPEPKRIVITDYMRAAEGQASEQELRVQVRELQAERDALLKDVEALCMQACPPTPRCSHTAVPEPFSAGLAPNSEHGRTPSHSLCPNAVVFDCIAEP